MTSRRGRVAASILTAALLLTACSGGSDNPDDPKTPTQEASSMYCELIDPKTVQPIVGSNEIKDIGGPVHKEDTRRVQCALYAPDNPGNRTLLTVYEVELSYSDDAKADARAKASADMAKTAKEDPEHYVALEHDGDDLGYAWYSNTKQIGAPDGTRLAAANLVTDTRSISVTAVADATQAKEYVPLLLKVAQEFDANLDAWDAKNPS